MNAARVITSLFTRQLVSGLLLSTAMTLPTSAQDAQSRDSLAEGFATPPQSARPRVWWHWMNGNITKEGIDKDLDWMQRIGIGGVQNFDVSLMTPQIVEKRLPYMSDDWKDAFRHAVSVADSKGLEFAIASSPGWSETGGPWVKPAEGMKKFVWAETRVKGGRRFAGRLPQPPRNTGPFQSAEFYDALAGPDGKIGVLPQFYSDIAVIAYPVNSKGAPTPKAVYANGKTIVAAPLFDSDLETVAGISKGGAEHSAALTLDYGRPITARSASIFLPHARPPFGEPEYLPVLEAEQGAGWRKVDVLPLSEAPTTINFAPITARRFRILFARNQATTPTLADQAAPGAILLNIFPKSSADAVLIADLRISDEAKVDRFEAKAGFATVPDYGELENRSIRDAPAIDPAKVLDLTDRLRSDGTLDWTTPKGGDWRIVRMGWSLTGKSNHPATPEATGLEVDKYDAGAVRRYLQTYLGMYREAVGPELMGAKGIGALLTDSIEVGPSNWTPRMIDEFRTRRGYDPKKFLPALTGAIIGSTTQSDAFLHDFRQTLADLLADAHYGTIAAVAHENGLKVYGEALENGRPILGDDLAIRKYTGIPMAALWAFNKRAAPIASMLGDIKGAASVAHIYGQNIVAAESMTSAFAPWAFAPSDLKRVIDLEFAYGVNRPVIHTSVHQPVDDKIPGLSLMIFGQYFNRHETWAEMAKPWVDYISRASFLLQQGRNVADIAYFYGEDAPLTSLFEKAPPSDLPTRYGYDFVNADVLINELSLEDGELVAKGGARYKALYLGQSSRRMTLSTLRRLADLADQGATIIGQPPERSPSLNDDPATFRTLVARLWTDGPVTSVGKGRIIDGIDAEAALFSVGVKPDFSYTATSGASALLFVHRKTDGDDIYFINNRAALASAIQARFRVTGKQPEIWRAVSGTAEPLSYRVEGDETVIDLDVAAEDAFFVVFRNRASTNEAPGNSQVAMKVVASLGAPWTVDFQPGRGAPATAIMRVLKPLETSDTPGIRYFSGIAAYKTHFTLPKSMNPGQPLWIDLGQVGDVAEVRVNGVMAGTAWLAPYRLDISPFVKSGLNTVEIKVANLWVNRLIGDQQPATQKITFTGAPTYRPDAPLRPSGLIGPVTLLRPTPR